MNRTIIILLIFFCINCTGQTADSFNLGFEEYHAGEGLANGWFKWGTYELSIDSISHTGDHSGKISSDANGSSFGSIAYKIPAKYMGKSIKLTGYMKIKDVADGFAGLLMRLDGNGTSQAFDNMQRRNIKGTKDWEQYTIELPFTEETESIYIAGILVGKGAAWFDDFVVSIDGVELAELPEIERPNYPARSDTEFDSGSGIVFPALTTSLVDNMDLLGRIWGLLKYHHPQVANGNYNWDYELFRILPEYVKAKNAVERDGILVHWVEKYGEIPKCDQCVPTPSDAVLKPDLSWFQNGKISLELKSKLEGVYQNRNQGNNYYIRLAPNVGNPEFLNENSYSELSYPDAGFRLLALYKYWNMINYFYPNKHLLDKNWNDVLKEYIPAFIDAKDELAYEMAAITAHWGCTGHSCQSLGWEQCHRGVEGSLLSANTYAFY